MLNLYVLKYICLWEHRNTHLPLQCDTSHTNHSCIRHSSPHFRGSISKHVFLSSLLFSSSHFSPSTVNQAFNYTCTLLRRKERCFSRSWNHCSVQSKHILTVWVTSSSSAYISSVTGSDDLCQLLLTGDLRFSSDWLSREP